MSHSYFLELVRGEEKFHSSYLCSIPRETGLQKTQLLVNYVLTYFMWLTNVIEKTGHGISKLISSFEITGFLSSHLICNIYRLDLRCHLTVHQNHRMHLHHRGGVNVGTEY